jgi:hypothetical protein
MIDLLKTIASPAMQKAYEQAVPVANISDELVCQWFDDFHPSSELFKSSFSENEIEELERFTEYFDARVGSIPNDGGVDKLQTNKEWLEVQSLAKKVCIEKGWLNAL